MVLQTIIPLQENRNFERKVKQSLSPLKIKDQKRIWTEEQRVKSQRERQDELMRLNQYQKQLLQEYTISQTLERENLNLLVAQKLVLSPNMPPEQDDGDGTARRQQQPNIHIENAKYIMIGNDSQMTLDFCGGTNKDNSSNSDEG